MNELREPGFRISKLDILMIGCTLVWGANYAALKFVMMGIHPMAMNAIRLALSAAVMTLYLKLSGEAKPIDKKDFKRFALGGIILLVYHFAYLYGIHGTLAWKASIMMGMMPIFVTLITYLMKDEIASIIVWIGVILSFIGLIVLMKGQISWNELINSKYFAGDLISLGAAILWAVYTINQKPLLEKYSPILISTYPLIIVAILFLPAALPQIIQENWSEVTLAEALTVILSGLLSIVVGSIVWYYSVKLGGNIRTAVYSNLTPVWAMIVSFIFLKEELGLFELFGAVLVLTGVVLSKFRIEMPGLKRNKIKQNKIPEYIK